MSSTKSGSASAIASATAGAASDGGLNFDVPTNGGNGGNGAANATATTMSGGAAAATATATATGGVGGGGGGGNTSVPGGNGGNGGNGTANATATAMGGGAAMATATATGGAGGTASAAPGTNGVGGTGNATASATTSRGARAQALATATGSPASAQSTVATSLGRVSLAQTFASASTASKATTNAIAQGGAGQMLVNPGQSAYAFATALPGKSYSTALIGGASMVADALLGPGEAVFGTSILGANLSGDGSAADTYSASSTFDFAYRGDLVLGLIAPLDGAPTDFQKIDFTVTVDGTEALTRSFTSLATADAFLQITRSTLAPSPASPTSCSRMISSRAAAAATVWIWPSAERFPNPRPGR